MADPLSWLVATFGPFLIPAVLFVLGMLGYWGLLALRRAGLVGSRPN